MRVCRTSPSAALTSRHALTEATSRRCDGVRELLKQLYKSIGSPTELNLVDIGWLFLPFLAMMSNRKMQVTVRCSAYYLTFDLPVSVVDHLSLDCSQARFLTVASSGSSQEKVNSNEPGKKRNPETGRLGYSDRWLGVCHSPTSLPISGTGLVILWMAVQRHRK